MLQFVRRGMQALLLALLLVSSGIAMAQEAAAPDGAAVAEEPAEEPMQQKSYLRWMVESSGPIGAVLFVMSFISVGLIINFALALRKSLAIPPELVEAFDQKLAANQYQEAYDLVAADDSRLAKVLEAGMRRVSDGHAEALEAMHEAGDDEAMKVEHKLSWLAILGTTGPLLGLLGTVEGIIASFRVIATSDTQPKPSLLAEGISTSLFNTFEGLLVAVIATVAFMLFKNQAARLAWDVAAVSERLMRRLKTAPGRRPAGT